MAVKIIGFLFAILILLSCNSRKDIPDVSGIKVNVQLERFEKDFFAIDTNDIPTGLVIIKQKHPDFYFDFMREILGVNGNDTNFNTISATKEFIKGYLPIYDSLRLQYANMEWFRKELETHLKYVKFYFPEYQP